MAASASTANTSIVTPTPASLRRLCRDTLPSILGATNGKRIMDTVAAVAETDRWNSFDRFHETTATLVDEYEQAGAVTEVMQVQTGGRIGTGRWIIQEAQDVHSATIDVIKPIRERVADYKQNPYSCIIDGLSTITSDGNMVKVVGWYDNEWAYSLRTLDLAAHIANNGK